jgi:methionyl-tRNA formyltransferase
LTRVNNINQPQVVASIRNSDPDYLLVIGWSQIVKAELLEIPRYGAVGFHPALLPENRGRAALPWVILRDLPQTGATLFHMDEGMDSGDIIIQRAIDVDPDETARSLYDKVANCLVDMMTEIAPFFINDQPLPGIPQDHGRATFTAKRTPKDGLIDWNETAEKVWTLIRAVSEPYPGAFTFYRDRQLTIWKAELVPDASYIGVPGQILQVDPKGALIQCGEGHVRLREVQEEQQQAADAADYFKKVHETLGIDWLALYKQFRALREEYDK